MLVFQGCTVRLGARGGTIGWVTLFKPDVGGLMGPLEFFIDFIIPAALGPWNRLRFWLKWVPGNIPGGAGGGVGCGGLTTLPHSCADCQKILVTQPPGTLRSCSGLYNNCFTCFYKAQAVRGWPVIAAACVRARPCGTCGGKSGTGTAPSTSTSIIPCQIIPPALRFHDLNLVGCDAV
jgi:hypothetical protein